MAKNLPKPTNLPAPISKKFDDEAVALLRQTYAKDLNDVQLRVFLKQCEAQDLNPFTKEIYGSVMGGRLVLMTSIGGLRKIAHKTGMYAGCKTTVMRSQDGKEIISATSVVKKIVGGRVCEFEFTAMFDEYNSGKDMWKKMPSNQIAKCAEAGALRMAFQSLEGLNEPAEEIIAAHEEIEVDEVQNYENESQEIPEPVAAKNYTVPEGTADPGEYICRLGSRKTNPTKIKNIPIEELKEYVKWAEGQEKLSPMANEYAMAAAAFLEKIGN